MADIYSNLFRYRPRHDRAPLEDFLSAALADLLNRAPRGEAIGFVTDVLLVSSPARATWKQYISGKPEARLSWTTQVAIRQPQSGILDILLLVDGEDAIVIENKISSPIRAHHEIQDNASASNALPIEPRLERSQLTSYGNWLAVRCTDRAWPGALVLLTHYTSAPSDFGSGDSRAYGVPFTHTCRWRQVWRWARRFGARAPRKAEVPTESTWVALCGEFANFLEGSNMAADYMTLHDLAAAEIFVGSANRIARTFAALQTTLDPARKQLGGSGYYGPDYEGDGGLIWDWFYLKDSPGGRWFISWGIRFPAISKWWLQCEPPLPQRPHMFVAFSSDGKPLPLASVKEGDVPRSWVLLPAEGLITARPTHELRSEADCFAVDMGEWLVKGIEDIAALVGNMTRAVK